MGSAVAHDVGAERLYQTRLADTGFATEQHYLAPAVFALRPTVHEQCQFRAAPHQHRCSSSLRRHLTLHCCALPVHEEDPHRLGRTLQLMQARYFVC